MPKPESGTIEINMPRSSGIYRYLGLLAVAREARPDDEFLRYQITTELAESLNAEMGTHDKPIMLGVDRSELRDVNGKSLTESAVRWSRLQDSRAAIDARLEWFARFAQHEAEEHFAANQFSASAAEGDTMLVVSPFPEEAYQNDTTAKTVFDEGFRPDIRRAFLRVYEKRADGLALHIQSVDMSNLATWNQVLAAMNLAPCKTTEELLSRRINHHGIGGAELIVRTALAYDDALYESTNNRYRYGKELGGGAEANTFVAGYGAIIDDTIAELCEIANYYSSADADAAATRVVYNSKALINDLYEQSLSGKARTLGDYDMRAMRSGAGDIAAKAGITFYGCSGETSATTSNTAESSLATYVASFTMKNNLEVHSCVTCPLCKTVVDAIRDPKSKSWFCPNTNCKGYDSTIVQRVRSGFFDDVFLSKQMAKEKDFGDRLAEFFFGSEAEKAAKKAARKAAAKSK